MSLRNIVCETCDESFASSKALKIHTTKIHTSSQPQNQNSFECPICSRKFSREYNLRRHGASCFAKNHHITRKVAEAKEETSKIKTELMVKEVEYHKKVADLLQQQLETVKAAPTTINNITNNNINNNVYNNNRSYTQQNNFLGENFDKLIPITEKSLKENFKQVFDQARINKHYLSNEKDIGVKLTTGPLKESFICTDASRGIVHWKDGDNDNKHIKDPQFLSLSNKMLNAIANNLEVVDDYKNFLHERQDSFNINTIPQEAISCSESSEFIRQLGKSETITKIAKVMAKNIPTELTFVKKEYKLEKFYTLIEKLVYKKPYEVLLQSASAIANWFFKALQIYGFSKNKNSEELISIVDDEDKGLSLSQKDIFNILRIGFERIERYDVIVKVSLSSFFDTFSDKVESFDDAETNFKKLDLWIKEENVEAFERSFYHFFEILLK